MNALSRFFAENAYYFSCLENARQGRECFLVGGVLRDVLLGRHCADYDLITPGDPGALARSFAEKTGGKWFVLDAARGHSRVVCKKPAGKVSFDFAPFRHPNLDDDLRDRDFTINAMALALHHPDGKILDPLGGRADLGHGFLRACSEKSFVNDPLRLLRGVRLALQFDLKIETHSFFLMKKAAALLDRIAAERIKNEFGRIFALGAPSRAVFLMEELGINALLWGPPGAEGSAVKGALWLEKVCALLDIFEGNAVFADSLGHCEEEGYSRATLIKLGLFLRGYDPLGFPRCLDRLRISRNSLRLLVDIRSLAERRYRDWTKLKCGDRGRALWVEALGRHPLELLVVLAALKARDALQALEFVFQAGAVFLGVSGGRRLPDLVAAGDLMAHGVKERNLSKVLAAIRREEIGGRVSSAEEALAFIRSHRKRD